MGLFQMGVFIAISGIAYVFFCAVAVFVVVRALRSKGRGRYMWALFAGFVGHAVLPLVLSLVYAVSGRWRLLDTFYDAPLGFINAALLTLGPSATKLNGLVASAAHLGFHVGFFAFFYLIFNRGAEAPSQKGRPPARSGV